MEWYRSIQELVNEIDDCIRAGNDEALTLTHLSEKLGYSRYHVSRKFSEIAGMQMRDYLRYRKLAFALKDIRDTQASILEVAMNHGF